MWILLGLFGFVLLLFGLAIGTLSKKMERHAAFVARLERLMRDVGAEPLDEETFSFEGRRFRVSVGRPTIFEGNFVITFGLYTPSVDTFALREAGGVSVQVSARLAADPFYRHYVPDGLVRPEIEEYLLSPDVRAVLQKVLPGRWKSFGKKAVEVYLSENVFHYEETSADEVALALRALKALDRPLESAPYGGTITFRSGFEDDVPPWHWQQEAIQALPEGIRRVVVSYYHTGPYLSVPLVELLGSLAGSEEKAFLFPRQDTRFLEHAFGKVFTVRDALLFASDPRVPVAADASLDGTFFDGFLAFPKSELEEILDELQGVGRHRFHEIAVANLSKLRFYARRLLDNEASWYSGEYEVLTTQIPDAELVRAVEAMATKHQARIVPIERRFTLKLFRDEKFEFTT